MPAAGDRRNKGSEVGPRYPETFPRSVDQLLETQDAACRNALGSLARFAPARFPPPGAASSWWWKSAAR